MTERGVQTSYSPTTSEICEAWWRVRGVCAQNGTVKFWSRLRRRGGAMINFFSYQNPRGSRFDGELGLDIIGKGLLDLGPVSLFIEYLALQDWGIFKSVASTVSTASVS